MDTATVKLFIRKKNRNNISWEVSASSKRFKSSSGPRRVHIGYVKESDGFSQENRVKLEGKLRAKWTTITGSDDTIAIDWEHAEAMWVRKVLGKPPMTIDTETGPNDNTSISSQLNAQPDGKQRFKEIAALAIPHIMGQHVPRSDVAGVISDVVMAVWQPLEEGKIDNLERYVWKVVKTKTADYFRKQYRQRHAILARDIVDKGPRPEESMEIAELYDWLRQIVSDDFPDAGDVVGLMARGMSVDLIATHLDVSSRTVRRHVKHIRMKYREHVLHES